MGIKFTKYHGTGNDFILIDDREGKFDVSDVRLIESMCERRFGIGADGLILLRNHRAFDFEMVYFNSDGRQSSMCGNGGRCIVKFAHELGFFQKDCTFLAIDGAHVAHILDNGLVKLKMKDILDLSKDGQAFVMDTGSPHYVINVEKVEDINVKENGAEIRYSERYRKAGINVNFLSFKTGSIEVATYERGVEGETFSCGTGVTAAAIAANQLRSTEYLSPIEVNTKGGSLRVHFQEKENAYTNVWLEGPAVPVYSGTY